MIIELLLVLGSFTESFWLGIFVLAYVITTTDKYKKVKNQLDICLAKNKTEEPKYQNPYGTADKIYPYKNCIIEQFSYHFVITMPSGKRLEKNFFDIENAKKEIDLVYPFLKKYERK